MEIIDKLIKGITLKEWMVRQILWSGTRTLI